MTAQGAEDADIANVAQTVCYAFVAWERFDRSKGKGEGKSKNGKKGFPRYSHGMKPNLSLEERKKALAKLKSATKCFECGETGHWAGDSACQKKRQGKQERTARYVDEDSDSNHSSCQCGAASVPDAPALRSESKSSDEHQVCQAPQSKDVPVLQDELLKDVSVLQDELKQPVDVPNELTEMYSWGLGRFAFKIRHR